MLAIVARPNAGVGADLNVWMACNVTGDGVIMQHAVAVRILGTCALSLQGSCSACVFQLFILLWLFNNQYGTGAGCLSSADKHSVCVHTLCFKSKRDS